MKQHYYQGRSYEISASPTVTIAVGDVLVPVDSVLGTRIVLNAGYSFFKSANWKQAYSLAYSLKVPYNRFRYEQLKYFYLFMEHSLLNRDYLIIDYDLLLYQNGLFEFNGQAYRITLDAELKTALVRSLNRRADYLGMWLAGFWYFGADGRYSYALNPLVAFKKLDIK